MKEERDAISLSFGHAGGRRRASYDGKDYPLIGDPDSDAISFKRIDPSTIEFTQKKAGKAVIRGTCTLSKDGRVMTIAATGTNAKGQAMNNVMVFEKR